MNSSRRKLSDEEIRILALACGFNCKLSGKDLEIQQRDIENYISKLSPELQESIYAETIELVKSNSKDFYLPKPKLKIFSDNIVLVVWVGDKLQYLMFHIFKQY